MNIKKLYLLRHAAYSNDNATDPSLSPYGREQSIRLGQKILSDLAGDTATIWSSAAARAIETAELIKQQLRVEEEILVDEKLWSDNKHPFDLGWLKNELEKLEGKNLVIISHLEYVHYFPRMLQFKQNDAGYASGVLIENGTCVSF